MSFFIDFLVLLVLLVLNLRLCEETLKNGDFVL